jgi:predicted transcriptional regulator
MVRMTFTLDRDTVSRLRKAAARLARPQSQVVLEAIREYAERIESLSEEERRRMLRVMDTIVSAIPVRPHRQVESESAEIRTARRRGGRRPWTAQPGARRGWSR